MYLRDNPDHIDNTVLYQSVGEFTLPDDALSTLIIFCYIQLIDDVLSSRAQNEHIAPAINKLKSKGADIRRVFSTADNGELFTENVVVMALGDVNLEMKKTISMALSFPIVLIWTLRSGFLRFLISSNVTGFSGASDAISLMTDSSGQPESSQETWSGSRRTPHPAWASAGACRFWRAGHGESISLGRGL
jgi:hypothetical protein